ncbi:DNA-binding protein [Pseudomonas sp. RC2C2]|uniref:DNA-binding protein n=1 Tax=Pseudomonas sp. RC2C2 TaxID=2834408 RepID=UPI001BCCE080|nr:DNA-binding protein [Pseudomonas sp. RC2C2]MBS7596905.1 DNA-binding protein [Pseudomonas sp. RC2C2]
MPQSGISRVQVRRARDALIKQGRHPSVEAVRAYLGNTGSNSTISRYLKELNAKASASSATKLAAELDSLMGDPPHLLSQGSEGRFAEEPSVRLMQQQIYRLEHIQYQEQLRQLKESAVILAEQLQDALERSQNHLVDERSEQMQGLSEGLEQLQAALRVAQAAHGRQGTARHLLRDQQLGELKSTFDELHDQLRVQQQALIDSQAQIRLLLLERAGLRVRLREQLLLVRQLRQDLQQRGSQVSQLQQMLERVIPVAMG